MTKRIIVETPVEPPTEFDDLGAYTAEMEARTVVEILTEDFSPRGAIEVARNAASWAADLTGIASARLPSGAAQCRIGCAWCCHVPVVVSAPEVLALQAHLRRTRSSSDLDDLRTRCERLAGERRAASHWDVIHTHCPLLVDGKCSAYDARPLACRGYNSLDARACERYYWRGVGTVPVMARPWMIHEWVTTGISIGLHRMGLDGRPLELIAALAVALGEPDAAKAWIRGRPVFAAAEFRAALPSVADRIIADAGRVDALYGEQADAEAGRTVTVEDSFVGTPAAAGEVSGKGGPA